MKINNINNNEKSNNNKNININTNKNININKNASNNIANKNISNNISNKNNISHNINYNENTNTIINRNININPNVNNNLNDKKSSIIVAIRIRPLNKNEFQISPIEGVKVINNSSLLVTTDSSLNNKKSNQIKEQQFFFDHVFDKNTSQQEIYENTTKNLLLGIIEGFNATVFAYGATGSGKTYTMLGTSNEKGIMTRSISDLFILLNSYKNKEFKMKVSYIEIYNEIIRDLLADGNVIDLHDDPGRGIILLGVKEISIENTDSFYDILYVGNKKRTTGSTNNNETSSRSHAVLRIILDNKDKNSNDTISGKFILVDLAGSEKNNSNLNNNNANNINNQERQKEGTNINKSLLALGVCINALASKSKFIPWRNSKLTRILKDSLGGNSRIVMISTISPSIINIDETINTLVYSNRAKNIQTIIKKNVISAIDHDSQVNKYDEVISNLTSELEGLRQQLAVKTHNKHLLPKKEFSTPNIQISMGNNKMEKLSKDITNHFNEEKKYKAEILDIKKNINNLLDSIKNKEFLLYKLANREELHKSSSVRNVLAQNYLRKVPKISTFKEKELKEQIKEINKEILSQKDLLLVKENKYEEIISKRSYLEKAIEKYGSDNSLYDNNQNSNPLQYLYQGFILEINNMENDYMRKKSLNEIRSKDIKIQKLVAQLKLRDEYIKLEKKQLEKKNINYYFEGEQDMKTLEELNIDKNFSLPFILQKDNKISTLKAEKRIQSPNIFLNRVNQISNGRYDYSGYCNPNIVKEKQVIKTKTNEIMRKTKRSQLSDLKLNMINEQYKNSKVFYVNKGTNPNISFKEEPNVITFDTKKLNKSQSSVSLSYRSQNDSFNTNDSNNRVFNYKEREIDNKIRKIMVMKKRISPYLK